MSSNDAEAALEGVLNAGKVRWKSNRTKSLRSKVARIAKGCPEVMVKITSFGSINKSEKLANFKDQIAYIAREGEIELETDRGDLLRGKDELRGLISDWKEDFSLERRRKNHRDTMHMILSMPEGTPEEAVREAARNFARRSFRNHEYVFALHTPYTDPDPNPSPHPHVHFVVKMRGKDGRRLNPRIDDLHDWRETFADAMRDQGVEAEASPRPLRGVARKGERGVVRQIERGDERRPPRISKVRALKTKEAAEELAAEARGEKPLAKPWMAAIAARRDAVKASWLAAAEAIERNMLTLKDQSNERPNYEKLDSARVRAGQRAAALYQSDLEKSGLKAPAIAITSLRDLPGLPVVQRGKSTQVLLLKNASNRMGRHRSADHEVRRSRASFVGFSSAAGQTTIRGITSLDSAKKLAERIRAFVQTMPAAETESDLLKRQLTARFSRSMEQGHAKLLEQSNHESAAPDQITQHLPGKDRDR